MGPKSGPRVCGDLQACGAGVDGWKSDEESCGGTETSVRAEGEKATDVRKVSVRWESWVERIAALRPQQ